MNHILGQGIDPNRVHASDIDRFGQLAGRIHHAHERLDRIVDIEKAASLHPVAPDRYALSRKRALDEAGDKLDAKDKAAVETDLNALKSLVDSTDAENMTDSQVDEIKAAKEKLMESAQKLFAKLYEAQQGAAGAGPDMGAGAGPDMNNGSASNGNPYGDDVVDGDYKEV